MGKRFVFLVVGALSTPLLGCTPSPEAVAAAEQQDAQTCLSYGFQPDSEAFAMCRMQAARDRAEADYNRRLALAGALQNTSNYYNQQAAIQAANRPRYTNCSPGYGGSISCTSY